LTNKTSYLIAPVSSGGPFMDTTGRGVFVALKVQYFLTSCRDGPEPFEALGSSPRW
jgi:hypothetical protein